MKDSNDLLGGHDRYATTLYGTGAMNTGGRTKLPHKLDDNLI